MRESYMAQNSLELKFSSRSSPPFYAKQITKPEEKKWTLGWLNWAPGQYSLSPISKIPCPSALRDNYSEQPWRRTDPLNTVTFHIHAYIHLLFSWVSAQLTPLPLPASLKVICSCKGPLDLFLNPYPTPTNAGRLRAERALQSHPVSMSRRGGASQFQPSPLHSFSFLRHGPQHSIFGGVLIWLGLVAERVKGRKQWPSSPHRLVTADKLQSTVQPRSTPFVQAQLLPMLDRAWRSAAAVWTFLGTTTFKPGASGYRHSQGLRRGPRSFPPGETSCGW